MGRHRANRLRNILGQLRAGVGIRVGPGIRVGHSTRAEKHRAGPGGPNAHPWLRVLI